MMEEKFERLTKMLMEKNNELNYDLARSWVEAIWEDFESTRAKAGREYEGQAVTERFVTQFIENYGVRIHEFASKNEKFKHLLK
uniref:WVELL protein n=2 Tax=Anaerobacillus isosaccharinicus TaxID=1532552 RepID=A0A1S2M6T8_9BACI